MGPNLNVCKRFVRCHRILIPISCFSHDSMVCLSGTRVESRIVSPGHTKSGKVVKQSPVATLTQRRTTPFDVSHIILSSYQVLP